MDHITIERLESHLESAELEAFIEESHNGTLFHHPKFLSYHDPDKFPQSRYRVAHFIFRKRRRIIAFLPGCFITADDGLQTYSSPHGASYGGFVTGDIDYQDTARCVALFLDAVGGSVRILMTPSAECYERLPTGNYWRFCLMASNFRAASTSLLLVRPLGNGASIESSFTHAGKKNLQTANVAGVTVRRSDDFDSFYPMLHASREKFDAAPTHSLDDLRKIRDFYPDRSILFVAERDGVLAAAAWCLIANSTCLNVFYACDEISLRSFRPSNAVLHEVLSWAAANQYRYVDFGPSTFGFTPNPGLIVFKESFGAKPLLRTTFERDRAASTSDSA